MNVRDMLLFGVINMSLTEIHPPIARREPHSVRYHETDLQDDYHWLRDKSSPEVIAYLTGETAYAEAFLQPTKKLQDSLYEEMISHIQETDISVPYRDGDWLYYTRTVKGLQYPIHCRRSALADDSPETALLDVNELAKGKPYMALGAMSVSPDGNLLAYSTDETGFRQYTMHIRDLRTATDLPDSAERVGSIVWASDSQTLFYSIEDETTKRHHQIYRHSLGMSTTSDPCIYQEEDERFNVGLGRTRDRKFLLLEIGSHTTTEYRFLPTAEPTSSFQLIAPRIEEQEYYPDHRNSFFYIRTNDVGKNFRVVKAPVESPGRENWQEAIVEDPSAPLEDFDLFHSFAVASRRVQGLPTLEVIPIEGQETFAAGHPIQFPDPTYSAAGHINPNFHATHYRYSYQSLAVPASVYEYDVATGSSVLLKEQEVPGGFDRRRYAAERVWVTAEDGERIPVSLVYRKDSFHKDGKNPLYVYGYGSYGYSLPVGFSPARLALLDRGLVMAYAHIRGGGEMGDTWHDAGKMMAKRNTFTDFIAAVEHLTRQGYGDPRRVAIEGGSAGGLLMGAVVNMRPELFSVVLSHVPFVDVMNTMLDASLPLTVAEYEEWGNPNEPGPFQYMLSYSPYDNLKEGRYPAMLVKTSLNDSQVMYWEPAKYIAKLRTLKRGDRPLLLHVNMDAGHGGASGRYDYLKEIAFDDAFLLTQLGVES